MARVALRTLTREIEDQIEHGQIDQAIANCRHILTYFPKHVDTYRLLGKAYMEAQRFGDAADVFQRVLSSVPEDFIAHLGMSIIQEDEGNLDDAIWHMERAFEMQPSNSAVQSELRRLYGRRDGLEPPKVRLTRGALARMYLKGGLYPQAISELRAALSEESQRPDLLTLLAKAYYSSGQKVEAADTCGSLLSRLPYSLEGNRLLADILSGSERANEAETYRQRVQALDPYSAHISQSTPNPENVPDGAVTLERLDWKPGQAVGDASSQPEWAASLGVNVAGLASDNESLPDWLSTVSSQGGESVPSGEGRAGGSPDALQSQEGDGEPDSNDTTPGLTDTLGGAVSGAGGFGAAGLGAIGLGAAGLAASEHRKDEEIPDWMKEAGWETSSGVEEEGSSASPMGESWTDEGAQGEDLAPADIPEWLRSMAPEGGLEPVNPTEPSQEIPLPAEENILPEDFAPTASTPGDVLPWLSENPPGASDSVVNWLENKENEPSEMGGSSSEETGASASELPEWLREVEEPGTEPGELSPEAMDSSSGLPEWLANNEEKGTEEEIPDWLKGMVETTEPGMDEPVAGAAAPADFEASPSEERVEWQPESQGEFAVVSGDEEENAPGAGLPVGAGEVAAFAWLAGKAGPPGEEEVSVENPDEQQEPEPEWLQATAGIAAEQAASVEAEGPVEELPKESLEGASEGEAELPDWLQVSGDQVETGGGIDQMEASQEQPQAASELPDWLRGLADGTGEGEEEGVPSWQEEETSLQPGEPDNLLDWLKEADETPADEMEVTSGLASLEEPPPTEEDTKPTWIAKASEVPIPATLVGFIAGAEFFKEEEESQELGGSRAAHLGNEGASQEGTVQQPEAVEETQAELLEDVPTVFEGNQPLEESIEGHPAEEAGSAPVDLVAGMAAAAFVADEAETEIPAGTEEVEITPDEAADQQLDAAVFPDWLRELEDEPESSWEPSTWAAEEAEQSESGEPTGDAESLGEDESFAWLEGLAARQGAEEGLLISPEERQEEPPEWVAAESAVLYAESEPEISGISEEGEKKPAGGEVFEAAPEIPDQGIEEPVAEEESTEPLDTGEESAGGILQTAAAAAAVAAIDAFSAEPEEPSLEVPAEEIQTPIEPVLAQESLTEEIQTEEIPELPAWLAGYEQAPAEEEIPWTPPTPAVLEEQVAGLNGEEPGAGAERLDLNQATLIELERVPGIGFVRAQALLAYREAHGPFTRFEDLQDVPEFDADTLAQIQEWVLVRASSSAEETPVDAHQLALIQARNGLAQGDRDSALDNYSSLVKNRALLPDVIQDLHEALYRFPSEVSIWQTLGDAYARNNQLQEAIDAYTKAEELLR